MTSPSVAPIKAEKACSGKCGGGACAASRVCVVAACEGMIALFEKRPDGALTRLRHPDNAILSSLDNFVSRLNDAKTPMERLVIVDSNTDIAWVHASLSPAMVGRVIAEIEYPLIPGWFREPPLQQLAHALEHIFVA